MSREIQGVIYGAAFGLLGLAIGWACGSLLTRRALQSGDFAHQCVSGPWGHVRYLDSIIEAPEGALKVASLPTNAPGWFLDVLSPLALKQKLRVCNLADEQIAVLQQCATPAANGAGYNLQPPDDFIVGLAPRDRASLYGLLACYTQNVAQAFPFRFDLETRKDWFEGAQLDAGVETLVRQLVYRQDNMSLFSDLALVLRRHTDPAVYAGLFRALSREATVLAYLRVGPDDRLKELAYYWGWPDRQEAVLTLLKSAQLASSATDVPLALLLPPFVRDHLGQYPTSADPEFSSCFYTCMNFFSAQPDQRFTNLAAVAQSLQQDYIEVTDPEYQLGDVILFEKKGEGVVQACNYIAERLVFTKNGGSPMRPWMLARLDDLVGFYSYPTPVTTKVMRRRDLIKHARMAP